jgi:hypothetical protein
MVRLNLKPLERLANKIRRGHGPLRDVYIQWAGRYQSFVRLRFAKESRGGGSWPNLAESTKKARARRRKRARGRQQSSPRRFAILRDTDTLYNALDPGMHYPGSLRRLLRDGVRVGYGGGARHPSSTRLTIARLAEIHHLGLGRVPKRKIIVKPDRKTYLGMIADLNRGLKRMEPWVR